MKNNTFVTQWVLDTVKKHYADDIALVVSHSTLQLDPDEPVISYFVPITEKGRRFAQTFILDGEGFDIWAIEWERLERFATLDEYNLTCLADGRVLYARTPGDQERFETLQTQLATNLADSALRRAHALASFEQARQIFAQMLFADDSDVKMCAGYVMDYLARSICFSYGAYFKQAQTDQLAELLQIGTLPPGFAETYNQIIFETDPNAQKQLCYELIRTVEHFLTQHNPVVLQEHHFQDLADWYAELSYTWLRLRHYCGAGDARKTYMWGHLPAA